MKSIVTDRKYSARFTGGADLFAISSLKLLYSVVIIIVSISVVNGAAAVPETIDKELILTQKEKIVLDKVIILKNI